jgi:hypothetical protein
VQREALAGVMECLTQDGEGVTYLGEVVATEGDRVIYDGHLDFDA